MLAAVGGIIPKDGEPKWVLIIENYIAMVVLSAAVITFLIRFPDSMSPNAKGRVPTTMVQRHLSPASG